MYGYKSYYTTHTPLACNSILDPIIGFELPLNESEYHQYPKLTGDLLCLAISVQLGTYWLMEHLQKTCMLPQ